MPGTFRYSQQAEDDLLQIHDHIAAHSIQAATRFVAHLHDNCVRLSEMPGVGVSRDKLRPGLRQWVVSEYLILYRLDADGLLVVRIIHGRRNLKKFFPAL